MMPYYMENEYEPPPQTAYDKALYNAYRKGYEAAKSKQWERCPYKRPAFVRNWELGYEAAYQLIEDNERDATRDLP